MIHGEKLFNLFPHSSYLSLELRRDMPAALKRFIETYYLNPIIHDTGYNPINTLTWALVLVVCLFLTFKLLKKLEIGIDRRFIAAVVPYILVGASLRVVEDAEVVSPPLSYLLITPLIFFLLFASCLAILILSVNVFRSSKRGNADHLRLFALIGFLWLIANLVILIGMEEITAPWVLFAVTGISGILVGIIYAIGVRGGIPLLTDRVNLAVLAAHLLDATSSYIGIDLLGYTGKHVLEGLMVRYAGTAAGMIPLKLGILIPLLYLLDTQFTEEEVELKNLVLLTLITIGLAPGVRNTLRLMLGV
ncbi:MAG: DUF63 family protein [Methanophagales archaeon ANME-1-THS]|nr:MAG: DUF63 family protein [Methanophagales archaeon ANME-1-THS]